MLENSGKPGQQSISVGPRAPGCIQCCPSLQAGSILRQQVNWTPSEQGNILGKREAVMEVTFSWTGLEM